MFTLGKEDPTEFCQFQGLPEAILRWLLCLRNFLAGWNVSASEETVIEQLFTVICVFDWPFEVW